MEDADQYLTPALTRYFTQKMKSEGEELFYNGHLSFAKATRDDFQVMIRHKGYAIVTMHRRTANLLAKCSCTDWNAYGVCKHIWASLLEAEYRGSLGNGAAEPPAGIVRMEGSNHPAPAAPPAAPPAWKKSLNQVRSARHLEAGHEQPRDAEYWLVTDTTVGSTHVLVALEMRERTQSGNWGKLKQHRLTREGLSRLTDSFADTLRRISGLPAGYEYAAQYLPETFRLPHGSADQLLKLFCESGRYRLRRRHDADFDGLDVAEWDDGPAWRFRMVMDDQGEAWRVHGVLERGEDSMELPAHHNLFLSGVLLRGNTWARLDVNGAWEWLVTLAKERQILVPKLDGHDFVKEVMTAAPTTAMEWPPELAYQETRATPKPHLRLLKAEEVDRPAAKASSAQLSYVYSDLLLTPNASSQQNRLVTDVKARRVVVRDLAEEEKATSLLTELGVKRRVTWSSQVIWEIPQARTPKVLMTLVDRGWVVEAEAGVMRRADDFKASLTTGIDWFELEGEVRFGDEKIKLPELLKALKKGETMVKLGDGTVGVIPEDFMARYAGLLGLSSSGSEKIRFNKNQAGVLDVFLAAMPEVRVDKMFTKAREELRGFAGIKPVEQPAGFQGQLREYQREGLAWMQFLQRTSFGGCLADDMGVGKTPQVLALLEARRALGKGPSLVVVPRSLIYNWREEAKRFTPELKVLDQSHAGRADSTAEFAQYNVVLMTYGTLLRDVLKFQGYRFDYAILDEAQAIKNATSESAKAARLITADHRLVMTGTPIENHLGELWSLMEFLNPGMLGVASVFQAAAKQTRAVDQETRQLLARALKPFVLRRTKGQVAKELPERIEQTIYCELEGEQRRLYNELRDYYRKQLLGGNGKNWAKQKIVVLEALLRLRQSACHPGLIDKAKADVPSAKLDTLMERLREVVDEGHKVLVFSQFTTYLGLVRDRLRAEKIDYAYLDGKTKDRQAVVNSFQGDQATQVFLISLKAGGTGLNLTAAEYVFLLDPWWNPAVEAQAIDRAHRIGQARTVFACRLIAKDTVEERVLELQRSKRELAEAIIGEDNRLVGNLSSEDLELLLS